MVELRILVVPLQLREMWGYHGSYKSMANYVPGVSYGKMSFEPSVNIIIPKVRPQIEALNLRLFKRGVGHRAKPQQQSATARHLCKM